MIIINEFFKELSNKLVVVICGKGKFTSLIHETQPSNSFQNLTRTCKNPSLLEIIYKDR